jgi:hypothetical protein
MSKMGTYVFFNGRTGQIVHTHREEALSGDSLSVSRAELLGGDPARFLEGRLEMEDLDVLEVDENSHLARKAFSEDDNVELYVDLEKKILSEKEKR